MISVLYMRHAQIMGGSLGPRIMTRVRVAGSGCCGAVQAGTRRAAAGACARAAGTHAQVRRHALHAQCSFFLEFRSVGCAYALTRPLALSWVACWRAPSTV
jgi:hypothetical protein